MRKEVGPRSAIETTGDGEVTVQSRIQMDLFKAKRKAKGEFERMLESSRLKRDEIEKRFGRGRRAKALYYPRHVVACTAANAVAEL